MERKTIGFLFMLVLVLAADVAVKKTEARDCLSKRHGFRGRCLTDGNCDHACRSDGFVGGQCRGLTRSCYCIRKC
ncbi:Defensin-like protein 4, partial [Mucuna pruriens]